MKNFKEFIHIVVSLNGDLPRGLNAGLAGSLPNRVIGDKAEQAVVRRLENIKYKACITPGSKSPADIFAVRRRQGYWHIMLIQVKSSGHISKIKKLNDTKVEELNELGKFVKAQIKSAPIMNVYADKPVLISTGYVGVHSLETKSGMRNLLKETIFYTIFRSNFSNVDLSKAKKTAEIAHTL